MKPSYLKSLLLIYVMLTMSVVEAIQVQQIASCNEPVTQSSVYVVLNSERNTLGGWSHIDTSTDEYRALNLQTIDYAINQENHRKIEGCSGAKVQQAILVVKLSDWTRQHSNGMEAIIDKQGIRYNDVTHVLIDLKINNATTYIPSTESLEQRYGMLLNKPQLKSLDESSVDLGITLFSEGTLDQSISSFNAEYFLSLDPSLQKDQWLRVLMPLSEFTIFTEKNYTRSSVMWADYAKQKIHGLRINSETSNGNQLRNILGDQWHDDIPESFKEISISLRRIEFLKLSRTN